MIRASRLLQIGAPAALLAASVLILGGTPAAFASDVYQWKDAKYELRSIYHRQTVNDERPAQTASTASPQCATARRNIELLQSGTKLQLDSNGDGKPDRDLSDNEREKQLQIAQTVARVNCSNASAKTPDPEPEIKQTAGY
jgi:hypothetical protein